MSKANKLSSKSIDALIKNDMQIVIVSGEGEGRGHIEPYGGTRTAQAIKSRLTRERCHGDRWAVAKVLSHRNEFGPIYINIETGEYCTL